MFIELTDILRCPQPHEEQFLVLIPDQIVDRSVRSGRLGCPVCRREYLIRDGIADFSGGTAGGATATIEPGAIAAFLGLGGPGGYVAVIGGEPEAVAGLLADVAGVHFVLVNPAADAALPRGMSLLRAGSIPIKSRSLRGVLLLGPFAADPAWQMEAARVLLPGLRAVGSGPPPDTGSLELLASAGGWWVAQKA
jgi:uncharacterized protein YbaR (Trm112 family)